MSKVNADYFPRNIDQYVPNMEFAADVVGDEHLAYLGAPAALDADGIWDGVSATNSATSYTSADYKTTFDGSSTSLTSTSGMIDAAYGRCLTATGSAGSDHVLTITGRDYLGQGMKESMTLSGTVVIHGNKSFKFVDSMSIASGAASDTVDIGWSNRLGLPYKAERITGYTEDDVVMPHEVVEHGPIVVGGTEYAAGTDVHSISPLAGQITGYQSILTTAAGTADNINTVFVGSSATDVAGLTITHTNPTAVGIADSDTATTDDDQPTSRVDKFESVGISGDGGGSGSAHYLVTIEPLCFVAGDDTATQTATTEDTRGTILLTTACNGSISYECRYKVDTADLHGIEQYNG
jgi:hypothetical protein